jgi:hypothetical protein
LYFILSILPMKNGRRSRAGNDTGNVREKRPFDYLGLSGKLFIALLGATLLFLTFPILDTYFRPVDDRSEKIIGSLNLSNLSIISSGRPLRHPESITASVNPNFSPVFCDFMINPEYLILNPPQYSQKHVVQ